VAEASSISIAYAQRSAKNRITLTVVVYLTRLRTVHAGLIVPRASPGGHLHAGLAVRAEIIPIRAKVGQQIFEPQQNLLFCIAYQHNNEVVAARTHAQQ
jgi:hypothetical protein